jgi:hypothetical protein
LLKRSQTYSPSPRVFLDRLVEISTRRQRARDNLSLEGLQRETNRLLRQSLVEQQLVGRTAEFEGRAFVRPMAGGPPAPTVDSLLQFHENATLAGDEPAREWARRQLEGLRTHVLNPEEVRRIDLACERPDQVNPRLVAAHVQASTGADPASLETFVAQAIASHDASACAAAFVMARQCPEGANATWVRSVLSGIGEFPDSALATLRAWEAETRASEAEAARAQAEFVAKMAQAEAAYPGLEAPTQAELDQRDRLSARPLAPWDQPIGLALERRGMSQEEFEALEQSRPDSAADAPETF